MMKFEIIDITPDMAREMLKHNIDNNRTVSSRKVNAYAQDMINGDWQLNSESISFNEDGKLTNGQHRLNAIIKAGIPVKMLVIKNESKDAYIHDRGRLRSASDIGEMSGMDSLLCSSTALAAIRLLGMRYCSKELTDSECFKAIEHFSNEIRTIVSGSGTPTIKAVRRSAVNAAFIFLMHKYGLYRPLNPDDDPLKHRTLFSFRKAFYSGFMLTEQDSPAIVMRNYVINDDSFNNHTNKQSTFSMILKAFEDYKKGVTRMRAYQKVDVEVNEEEFKIEFLKCIGRL